MADPKVGVYPDPDGQSSANYVPVSGPAAMVSIGTGLASIGTAAAGTMDAESLGPAFIQAAAQYGGGAVETAVRLITAVPIEYVAVSILFGLLSVGLAGWNLYQGYRMKLRLQKLSSEMAAKCSDMLSDYQKNPAKWAA